MLRVYKDRKAHKYIVTHMPIARQRLAKHIPEITLSTIEGHALLGNGPINTHSRQQKMVFSVDSVPRIYKRAQSEELKEYDGLQRGRSEYSGVVEFSSAGSQNSSSGLSSRKKMSVCQIVICELL
jgi:hypothetical protein